MRNRFRVTPFVGLLAATAICAPMVASADSSSPELSAGVWWVYQNVTKSDFKTPASYNHQLDKTTWGNFSDPAFILYAHDNNTHGPWHFRGEFRIGTGSFTNPANNNSGGYYGFKRAWIGYDVTDHSILKIGKSHVPFGWKTVNFWPGDGLEGGYGDQQDIGLKYSSDIGNFHYDVAYFHQDDWGETSTDTMDDNGHWGTSKTYRKIKTGVLNLNWTFIPHNTIGVSYQYGRLQDLVPIANGNPGASNDNGSHQEYDLHYMFEDGPWSAKYRYISVRRNFNGMNDLLNSPNGPIAPVIKNHRHVVEGGYHYNQWFFYVDGGVARSQTRGNHSGTVEFAAPGARYNYGPGWIYFEYLQSNGDINSYGDPYRGSFNALYIAMDYYFN